MSAGRTGSIQGGRKLPRLMVTCRKLGGKCESMCLGQKKFVDKYRVSLVIRHGLIIKTSVANGNFNHTYSLNGDERREKRVESF